jgi:ethanolamine utilization protein EutN
MLKGKVISNIVSTRKQAALVGSKFLEVQLIENNEMTDKFLIAVDSVGAGIGETVLVTTGSSARLALRNTSAPTDAVVVGIVDYTE